MLSVEGRSIGFRQFRCLKIRMRALLQRAKDGPSRRGLAWAKQKTQFDSGIGRYFKAVSSSIDSDTMPKQNDLQASTLG